MKNSKKEVIVLYFLLICLAVYAFYTLLLSPKINSNRELNDRIISEEANVLKIYNAIYNYKENSEQFLKDRESMKAQLDKFYSADTMQEEYLDLIDEIFGEDSMTMFSISSSERMAAGDEDFVGFISPLSAYTGGNPENKPVVEKLELNINYEGDYEDINRAFTNLEQNDKYVICNDLSIDKRMPEEKTEDALLPQMQGEAKPLPQTAEGEAEPLPEEEKQSASMNAKLVIMYFYNLSSLDADVEILENVNCAMPMELASGEYRNMYSKKNILSVLEKKFPFLIRN